LGSWEKEKKMRNGFFVLVLFAFSFVLAGCPKFLQQSVQTPNQINPIELLNGIRDKANIEGLGVLEYELYNVPGNASSDFKAFVQLYTGILEDGHDGVRGIYVFDHDNHSWGEDNKALSENVKKIMANHQRNLSKMQYIDTDGSTRFMFNYLNADGKYEFYTVVAKIHGEKNEYSEKEDYDKAITDFTEAIRLDTENKEAYINRGLAYYLKNDYDQAIEDYTKTIQLDPENMKAYSRRGLAYYFYNEYDKAIADFTKVIQFDPKSKTISDYTEAIRLDPRNAEAYINRGWEYYLDEDYDKAILDYTEAIRLDPKNAKAYHYRGLAYYWKNDNDRAISEYNESIRLDSKSAWTYGSRGDIYYLKEDYDKAILDYTEAIRLDPKSARRYRDRAEAYDKNSNYDRAIADYKAALRINPDDTEIKQKLEEVQRKQRSSGSR
jgi:tetratricopeptide (TPR) repeat protein